MLMPFEWVVGDSSKDHTVTASMFYDVLATVRYTTLRGITGASNSRDLQDLSTLIGERDEFTDSVTLGDYGSRTNQRSVRRVPIMPPDRIRTMPFGTGVVLLRSAPPIITDLHPWPKRSDAAVLKRERSEIEALLEKPPAAE